MTSSLNNSSYQVPHVSNLYKNKISQIVQNYKYNILSFLFLTLSLSGDVQEKVFSRFLSSSSSKFQLTSVKQSGPACTPLDTLANYYVQSGLYSEAMTLYLQKKDSLNLADTSARWDVYSNLGWVSLYMKKYEDALIYYKNALKLAQKQHNSENIVANLNDLSAVFSSKKQYDSSLFSLEQALPASSDIQVKDNPRGFHINLFLYGNLVDANLQLGNNIKAEYYLSLLSSFIENTNDLEYKAFYDLLRGKLLSEKGSYALALQALFSSLHLSKQIGYPLDEQSALVEIVKVYSYMEDYKNCFIYYKQWYLLEEQRVGEVSRKSFNALEVFHNTKELALQNKAKDAEIKTQNIEIIQNRIIIVSSFMLLCALGYFLYNRTQQKKRVEKLNKQLNEKNITILETNVSLLAANEKIKEQQKVVDENFEAGRKKQSEAFPSKEKISAIFPEHVLIDLPLMKVSGDFYWVREQGDAKYFALGDVRGHGVPASYQTIDIQRHLSDIMRSEQSKSPADILNQLDVILLQESIEKFSFDHPLDAEIFKKIALYLKKDPLVLIEFLFTADHGSIATDLQSALAALFTDSFSLDTLVSLLQNKAYAATIKEDYRDGPFLCEWYKRLASLYRDTMKKDIPVFSSDVAVSDLQQVFIHHFSKLLEEKIKKFEAFDMGLCSYTISTGQLQYAGAMTDLIVFPSTGEWKFEKAQRSKMGKKDNSDFITFENISLDVHSGDFFLLYSDGAVDQFGGPTVGKENAYGEKDIYGKKILFKRLHEEVVRLQKKGLSAAAITEELKKFILEWRHVGTENELDQIDDITLFGVQPKI